MLIAAASTASFALEEQRGPAPIQAEPAESAGVRDTAQQPAKTETGTEIRIPGLGRLGTLPKMDFGLELLYGAADDKQPQPEAQPPTDPNEDLTIRGSVKHRF